MDLNLVVKRWGLTGFHPNIWPDHEIYKYGFARNLLWMFTHAGSPENISELYFFCRLRWIVGNRNFWEDMYREQPNRFWTWFNVMVCAAYSACPLFTGTLVSSPTEEKVSKYCSGVQIIVRQASDGTYNQIMACSMLSAEWPMTLLLHLYILRASCNTE